MKKGRKRVEREVVIQAPKEMVFRFFADRREWKEWICDKATAEVAEGGKYAMKWLTGYEASGTFLKIHPPDALHFTWWGKDDPAETEVQISLLEIAGGTRVQVRHSGIGASYRWKPQHKEIEKGWDRALENLKSVLETGIDLRLARRPRLGIVFEMLKPEEAEKAKLPIGYGIRVGAVAPDTAAERAGLQKGDILVEMAGMPLKNEDALIATLQKRRAGDSVEIKFYRGPQLQSVSATLGSWKFLEIPATHSETVAALRKRNEELVRELDSLMAGVTEEAAERKPAPEKWCAKEVLAHLIVTEQWWRFWMAHEFSGMTVEDSENTSVYPEVLRAVLAVNPNLLSLRNRLAQEQEETVAMFEALRQEFQAHKARYRRNVTWYLEMAEHTRNHFKQFANAMQ